MGPEPVGGGHAPPVAGVQAGEPVRGDRRRQVVADQTADGPGIQPSPPRRWCGSRGPRVRSSSSRPGRSRSRDPPRTARARHRARCALPPDRAPRSSVERLAVEDVAPADLGQGHLVAVHAVDAHAARRGGPGAPRATCRSPAAWPRPGRRRRPGRLRDLRPCARRRAGHPGMRRRGAWSGPYRRAGGAVPSAGRSPMSRRRAAGWSAQGVLDEVVGAVSDGEPGTAVPAAAEVAPDRVRTVGRGPRRRRARGRRDGRGRRPAPGRGRSHRGPVRIRGDAVGPAEVAAGEHPQEAVGRRGGVEVDGEGHGRPDVEVGTGLVVGVPPDARSRPDRGPGRASW